MPLFDFLAGKPQRRGTVGPSFKLLPSELRQAPFTPPALPALRDLPELCGDEDRRWLDTGIYLLNREDCYAAERCFRSLLERAPELWTGNFECQANLAASLRRQGRLREALDHVHLAIAVVPKELSVRRMLVELMDELEFPSADVLREIDAALELAPADDDLLQRRQRYEYRADARTEPNDGNDGEELS